MMKEFYKARKEGDENILCGNGGERLGLVVNLACLIAVRVDIVTILIITNTIHFNCGIKIPQGIYCNFQPWITNYLTNINYHSSWEVSDFCQWGKSY